MKTEFKAKFIQHLSQKERQEGFTLIELLVVIIIIGILAAIALPSFLNQAAKAKQSEAKNTVGAVMRQQQAVRLEEGAFASTIDTLGAGLASETGNYTYEIITDGNITAVINSYPNDPETLRAYAGGVVVYGNGQTAAAACQTSAPSATPPTITLNDGASEAAVAADCGGTDFDMK
ncbi:type IV pilin-like G/H family protein [Baaleninema simplex]|uniref:type IV pilin-like G/H family protein n=1 Tax=Baaleninema simplex TaxID=2862350 RepID=UPI000346E8E5|nr:type IV pilin-like G/H family protein [Baaleninema simplex]